MNALIDFFRNKKQMAWAVLATLFIGPLAGAASISLNVKITPSDPMLPAKASTSDVLKQGFSAQLLWGDSPQLPSNVTNVRFGQWKVTNITFKPLHGRQSSPPPQGFFEDVAGVTDGSRKTLTSLVFNKAGHWTVTVSANAGYNRDGQPERPITGDCTVEVDIVEQPLQITINNTEDKLGASKITDDFVPTTIQGFPRPYITAEIKLVREGFPPGRTGPQEVKVKVSRGGVLRNDDANVDWTESTIQLTPGAPAKKFKLFGAQPSASWDSDHIEAQLVNPPEAFKDVSPAKEDFTAFKLERGVVWGTVANFNPNDAGHTVDPANISFYAEGSDRVPFFGKKAKIRFGAIFTPEIPKEGVPAGGITHQTLSGLLTKRLVWTLPAAKIYANKDYKGSGPQPIGANKKQWQTTGLDWRHGKSDGGPYIEIVKDGGKMPEDNDGFGPLAAPSCELRWPTTLNGNNVKVAGVAGQVPRLFFQRLGNDNPGKGATANWCYYWAKEKKGAVCAYSGVTEVYRSSIPGHPTAWGAYFVGDENTPKELLKKIVLADTNITSPKRSWAFPLKPTPKTDKEWVSAKWEGVYGPDFVNLTFAHESTHKLLDDMKRGQDSDQDWIADAWEQKIAGMDIQSGSSFGIDQFAISRHGSAALADQEFYCTLGSAIGFGTAVNPANAENPGQINKASGYEGIIPQAANTAHDWSVNGENWSPSPKKK